MDLLTEMHVVLSEDTLHDPAAVMHYMAEVLIPFLKDNVAGFAEGNGVMHLITDGAPNQFHCKDIYFWTSRCKSRYKILCDWVIGCAAHGKDTSDGECGQCKYCINKVNLEFDPSSEDTSRHVSIQTVPEVVEYMKEHGQPKVPLLKKKGVGIWRRVVHHVGLKEICRRVLTFDKGIDGSKSLHQYVDTGKEGQLLVRERPCHKCDCCMTLDWKKMMAAKDDGGCQYKEACGTPQLVTMTGVKTPKAVLDATTAETDGTALAEQTRAGDFVAVEINGQELPWVLGHVVVKDGADEGCFKYSGPDVPAEESLTGIKIGNGDGVVLVQPWLPMENGGGASVYGWRSDKKAVPVPSKNVRFKFSAQEADDTHFKVRRRKTEVKCRFDNGHRMGQSRAVEDDLVCDLCNCDVVGRAWTCSKKCDYDICSTCYAKAATTRHLQADTKALINSLLPNVGGAADPNHGRVVGGDWKKLYTVHDNSKTLQQIAIDLEVSQAELIENNDFDDIELHAGSRFRTGTTLWCPGTEEEKEDEQPEPRLPSAPPGARPRPQPRWRGQALDPSDQATTMDECNSDDEDESDVDQPEGLAPMCEDDDDEGGSSRLDSGLGLADGSIGTGLNLVGRIRGGGSGGKKRSRDGKKKQSGDNGGEAFVQSDQAGNYSGAQSNIIGHCFSGASEGKDEGNAYCPASTGRFHGINSSDPECGTTKGRW